MNRTIPILENITKLSTNILMNNSNNYLSVYLEKILNKKSKNLKYIPEFNCELLELLYTSLQMMNYETLRLEDYNKLDKIELRSYLTQISYYKNQVPSLKTDLQLINYITKSLSNGSYAYTSNGKVKFDNGLLVEISWLVEFSNFLVKSFNTNEYLSNDRKTYSFKLVELPNTFDNIRGITKETIVYEFNIVRQDRRILKYDNVNYLSEITSIIDKYDFKLLKELTSKLGKNKFNLSVNKKQARFTKDDKLMIEKYLNENTHDNTELIDYIKETLESIDSRSTINKLALVDSYEILKNIAYDYKDNLSIEKAREKYDLDDKKQFINNALAIAEFYNYYIYDEEQLKKYFDYEKLDLNKIKPTVIDYETEEYKSILAELSSLNKKVVAENRNINRLLAKGKIKVTAKPSKNTEHNAELANSCRELERLASNIKKLRAQLTNIKDSNDQISNINKTKIRYIKESIIEGKYKFNNKDNLIIFDCYSKKDGHKTFHLEITLDDFEEYILSEDNQKLRLEFYQK